MSPFPTRRPRRLRRSASLRRLIREHELTAAHLIQPVFVVHGSDVEREIAPMPGVFHLSVDGALDREVDRVAALGIPALLLFGLPESKDDVGSENFAADGIVQQALRRIRARTPDLLLITDVCCCEYTSHGHCGVLKDRETRSGKREAENPGSGKREAEGQKRETGSGKREATDRTEVDNDRTLEILGRVAVSHAEAGADVVAPSGMMDGMVAAIRGALDRAGHTSCSILSYAVKYASAFYGPFREAAGSTPAFGDRRGYQMDPSNVREALTEAALDEDEGADMLMVKPALAYLDVVRAVRAGSNLPLVTYNVSGEYAMVKAAAERGWLDERAVVLESLVAMRRAGADAIITYHAKQAARWLQEPAGAR